MKRKNKIIGNIFYYGGMLLLLAAFLLVFYNRWEDKRAGEASADILTELEEQILSGMYNTNQENSETPAEATGSESENPSVVDSVVAESEESSAADDGSAVSGGAGNSEIAEDGSGTGIAQEYGANINGDYYIGIIKVPYLGISLPVMSNWSYANLRIAPCRYTGSAETNDLVIAGHNYTSHFSPLKWIKIGSQVIFVAIDGTTYNYTVVDRETVQPEDVAYMVRELGGEWDLTLFTCNTGGQTRCAVRCVRN